MGASPGAGTAYRPGGRPWPSPTVFAIGALCRRCRTDRHGCPEGGPAGSAAVERVLDSLAGGEPGGPGCRDRDRLAGLGIAPLTLAALGDPERPEAGDADLLALLQRVGDRTDQHLQGLAGVGPGQAGALRDGRDQLCLVHDCPLEAAANTDSPPLHCHQPDPETRRTPAEPTSRTDF